MPWVGNGIALPVHQHEGQSVEPAIGGIGDGRFTTSPTDD